ncbi:hypothetical protein [Bacillus gaemokensis]|nr:hypothetical protein [Bacillus gaemokensis]
MFFYIIKRYEKEKEVVLFFVEKKGTGVRNNEECMSKGMNRDVCV